MDGEARPFPFLLLLSTLAESVPFHSRSGSSR
jgi:hypothetical protein